MPVENLGDGEFAGANDGNIPVNIYLLPAQDEEGAYVSGFWELRADLFMPRKGLVEGFYRARSTDPEELQALVQNHVVPLYKTALGKLIGIAMGTETRLYYWGDS
jgi:hypothetical protein